MLQEGEELAGYKILRKIGEGGMGQVFLAEQLRLRRQVAIKLVRLDAKEDAPAGAASPAEELTREAQALMALEHPHILPLYDTGREDTLAYLVMPYIPEGSLQDALRPGPRQRLSLPLAPAEALVYIEQAASALQYAHDRNFIHRDVKPANFLVRVLTRSHAASQPVNTRLHLFLGDFGLSKFLSFSTSTTHLSGTPTYMAPEQFQGRAGPASDQYSLAILLYYLLTGDLPFRGSPVELMFKHLHDAPPLANQRAEGLPQPLANVILRGMAKKPEERYPSVMGLAEAARDALVDAGVVLPHDSFPAVAAVRPAESQPAQQPAARQENPAAEAETLLDSVTPEVAPVAVKPALAKNDRLAPPLEVAEVSTFGDSHPLPKGSSLPTLPMEKPRRPPRRPEQSAEQSADGQPRRRGLFIVLAAVAAILIIGGVLGAGLLLQPQKAGAPVAQATRTAPVGQATATATSLAPTATVIPPATILNSILATSPTATVDLTQGDAQWDDAPFNTTGFHSIHTPSGTLDIVNTKATYNKQTFSVPLAVAVDLHAGSDQEFDIFLDTTDGSGNHQAYDLKLAKGAPPEVDLSTDGKTFAAGPKGTTTNDTWADGGTHTLVLVLDGTRLLFYIDKGVLLDTQIPLPKTTVALTLGTLNEAFVTGITIYAVPKS
ncbi:MAG TPA: protein kinase [Ktedonobacterales bacterium]